MHGPFKQNPIFAHDPVFFMISFKRIDITFISYVLLSSIMILFSWSQNPYSLEILFIRIWMVLAVIGLLFWTQKTTNSLVHLIRESYPIILSGYFYSETVFYNKLFFSNLDPYLEKLEFWIFGFQPSTEFSAYFSHKLMAELMYFGYFSFYLLILGFVLYFFFKRKEFFLEAIFKLSTSLYIFYLIFSIFPSAGPQFYFSAPQNLLPDAYIFDEIMHFIQKTAEQPTGAFPSSHVGISLIFLILSRKKAPLFYKMALPFVLFLILSTVYIKAHYAIDVLGGLLIAPFVLYLSDFLYQLPISIQHKSTKNHNSI